MLLADPQQILGIGDDGLRVISMALDGRLAPERMNSGRKVAQRAAEANCLFDQPTRALKVAQQPRRMREESPRGHSGVPSKLFSSLAVALRNVTVHRVLELA